MEQDNQQLTKRERRHIHREEKLKMRAEFAKKRKVKRLVTWLVAIIVLVGAGYGVSQLAGESSNSQGGSKIAKVDEVVSSDWVKGNKQALVTLVEYSDFQCPACGSYFSLVERINKDFGQNIRFVYRHFPLSQVHHFAELAARASEAAGKQGKFWEMYNLLFINQSDWSQGQARDKFIGFAKQLQLNEDQFKKDIDSKKVKDKVKNNYASGLRAGVNSTPSFFLNGQKISNPRNYNAFAALIQTAINEAKPLEVDNIPTDTSTSTDKAIEKPKPENNK